MLRRQWKLLLLCAVLVPAAALGLSMRQQEQYKASAFLLFRDPGFDQKLFGSSSSASEGTDPVREAATNIKLVSLEEIAQRTASAFKTPRLTAKAIGDKVSVSGQGESNIAEITAEDKNPRFAARLSNAFAEQYISFRQEADRARVTEAQRLVQAQISNLSPAQRAGVEGERLRNRSRELEELASLQTGNAELVQRARAPGSPSSPKPKRNVALGIVLGLVLGFVLALLRGQLDRRLRSPEDVQQAYGLPVLANVPQTPAISMRRGRFAVADEAFRMLRANLRYFNVDREIKSILTTSAAPRDGKTTISWNLALTEAQAGKRVLLVEADLRSPTLAQTLSVEPRGGLSLLLGGLQPFEQAVTSLDDVLTDRFGTELQLDVLFAGLVPPNPTELIESKRMQGLLKDFEREYDLVVVDTPPTAVFADAIPLTQQVTGVIVVARVGRTKWDNAVALRKQLDRLDAPVLGVVLNGGRADEG